MEPQLTMVYGKKYGTRREKVNIQHKIDRGTARLSLNATMPHVNHANEEHSQEQAGFR